MQTRTKQEIYDIAAHHLMTQDVRSRQDEHGGCMYRGPNGLQCAVGCLIPDEIYDGAMEGKSAMALVRTHPETQPYLGYPQGGDQVAFLTRLQRLHDKREPSTWHEELRSLALSFHLTPIPE